ncbi:MAG: putative solute-binding protein, partial [Moraxellaceae bacterium]
MAAPSPKLCVFDPAGADGELYALAGHYLAGSAVALVPYHDERIAVEDFKAGRCDGVAVSSFRARAFNPFVASIDAPGALASPVEMKSLATALANPRLAPDLVRGNIEVAGVLPLGNLYVLVRDRHLHTPARMVGRRVGVLEWDRAQARIVQSLGAQPVGSDVSQYALRFNNGQVDVIAAPALLFRHFELERGVGERGAVFRFPLMPLTATVLVHRDRFPEGFGAALRARIPARIDGGMARVAAAEAAIKPRYWQELTNAEYTQYRQMVDDLRAQMQREGFYD